MFELMCRKFVELSDFALLQPYSDLQLSISSDAEILLPSIKVCTTRKSPFINDVTLFFDTTEKVKIDPNLLGPPRPVLSNSTSPNSVMSFMNYR